MIDGDKLGLIEINDFLERFHGLKDVLAVERLQGRQADVLPGIGRSILSRSQEISQTALAAKVGDKTEMGAIPGEQVRTGTFFSGRHFDLLDLVCRQIDFSLKGPIGP